MVTRPTNHITLTRDHSHDLDTWPTNFILTSRYHWFQLPHHHSSKHQAIIDSNIRVTIPISWLRLSLFHHQNTCLQPIVDLEQVLGGLISRSTPIQDPVVVMWEESPRSLLIKATGGSHGKWWAGRLAGRSISPTLEDVNVSFNHLPYYSMSRGDCRVVTNKWVAW